MSGINPKYLPVEKKVQYNIRVPQRLIDKYTAYANLTGNTTTNIINNVLNDFIDSKVVLNDYLDNTGGVAVKIPYSIKQKKLIIADANELIGSFTNDIYVRESPIDSMEECENYLYELFEIKKIPNNLDVFDGDSFTANGKTLLYNKNALHSGIELFVYNITDVIFADGNIHSNDFNSFVNCLYCFYFEVSPDNTVNVYLINHLMAINLLLISGNVEYKDLIVAVISELEDADDIINGLYDEYDEKLKEIKDNQVNDVDKDNDLNELINELSNTYEKRCESFISKIADRYNSNNIIPFGADVFNRVTITKPDEIASNRINEILKENIKMKEHLHYILERIAKLEKDRTIMYEQKTILKDEKEN